MVLHWWDCYAARITQEVCTFCDSYAPQFCDCKLFPTLEKFSRDDTTTTTTTTPKRYVWEISPLALFTVAYNDLSIVAFIRANKQQQEKTILYILLGDYLTQSINTRTSSPTLTTHAHNLSLDVNPRDTAKQIVTKKFVSWSFFFYLRTLFCQSHFVLRQHFSLLHRTVFIFGNLISVYLRKYLTKNKQKS